MKKYQCKTQASEKYWRAKGRCPPQERVAISPHFGHDGQDTSHVGNRRTEPLPLSDEVKDDEDTT